MSPNLFFLNISLRIKGKAEEFEVESARFDRNSLILKLRGIDDLAQADGLAGADLCVPEESFPFPGEGTYYHFQILGCRVFTREGEDVGGVEGLIPQAGNMLLSVVKEGKESLVPFHSSICVDVDLAKKEILIDPPEGLLELNEI